MTRMPNSNRLHSAPCAGKKPYQLTVEEVLKNQQSQPSGLTHNEASARLARDGLNALPEKAGKPAWLRFLAHFHDVLIYVLIAAAALTAVMGHWVDTAVILGVAVINALIGHIQENNAEKSLKSIRNMLSASAVVVRNGQHETVATTDLVVGDIVVLRAGDRIPADLRETMTLAVQRNLAVWLSGVQITLEEFQLPEFLPNKILLCGGGAGLAELRDVLATTDWFKELPFARRPVVHLVSASDMPGIKNESSSTLDSSFITALGLLRVALDTLVGVPDDGGLRSKLSKLLQN